MPENPASRRLVCDSQRTRSAADDGLEAYVQRYLGAGVTSL